MECHDRAMSFDVFLQGFRNGDSVSGDRANVRDALDPFIADSGDTWANLKTADGDAEVYGFDDLSTGLMFTHFSGRAIWDVLFDVARAGGFVVMPIGCPVSALDEGDVEHLPGRRGGRRVGWRRPTATCRKRLTHFPRQASPDASLRCRTFLSAYPSAQVPYWEPAFSAWESFNLVWLAGLFTGETRSCRGRRDARATNLQLLRVGFDSRRPSRHAFYNL